MNNVDNVEIENFLHGQLKCWNAGDRDGFFEHYRKVSPNGLDIEYLGRPVMEGFAVLEGMWDQQNSLPPSNRSNAAVSPCLVPCGARFLRANAQLRPAMIAAGVPARADPDPGRAIPIQDSPYEQTTLGELAH